VRLTRSSLAHLFGTRRYDTNDTSKKNNWLLAILTLGEGWHNNHHHFMASARQGFFWREIDNTYYLLKVGLVWNLRKVPKHCWQRKSSKLRREQRFSSPVTPVPEGDEN
jgi:stearoyl-CoA desaturase (Delta-9 desaturase)